jgi:PAS domain S-box-containing protein
MPARSQRLRVQRLWAHLEGPGTVALALALFGAIFLVRMRDPNVANGELVLFVVPVALLAINSGVRGGLAGGLLAMALIVAWDISSPVVVSPLGYASRAVAVFVIGTLLGVFVDYRRALETQIARCFNESVDLIGTAEFSGRLTSVNPAWERLLGRSAEEICSHTFIHFVHPEDREATIAEAAALGEGIRDTVGFRNRYRAADGSYRLVEWTGHGSPSEGVLYAVGRDITVHQQAEEQLADHAEILEAKVAERTREIELGRAKTLQRLALAAEYRDDDTFQHTERVGTTSAEIGARLGLDAEEVELLREAAPLHDVGKIAIPDRILLKRGKLTADEYEVMQTHAALGARLLADLGSPVLTTATLIAESHHERWDGTGYPGKLSGQDIPIVGRIVAVADVFDALTHDRPYKPAWRIKRALIEIQRGAGTQFDPSVVAAFLTLHVDADAHETTSPARPPHHVSRSEDRRNTPARRTHPVRGAPGRTQPPVTPPR